MKIIDKTLVKIDKNDIKNGELIIPDGVEKINLLWKNREENLLEACKKTILKESIMSIIMPDSVIELSSLSFMELPNLTNIHLSDNLEVIKRQSFYGCRKLVKIHFPKQLRIIEPQAFRNCYSLRKVSLPEEMEKICSAAFEECTSLKEVILPKKISELYHQVFADCHSLEQINLPENLTIIEDNLFESCKCLKQLIIPTTVKTIGIEAFKYCESLEQINLPNNLEVIGDGAFSYCKKLEELSIPSTINVIRSDAFYNCTKLKLTIDTSLVHFSKGTTLLYFESTFNVKELIINNKNISLMATDAAEVFYDLQRKELKDIIACLLDKLGLLYNKNFFQKPINYIVEQLGENFNFDYKYYLVNQIKEYINSMSKTEYKINSLKYKFHKKLKRNEVKCLNENVIEIENKPKQKFNNDFDGISKEEVYELLVNYQDDKIQNIDINEIIEYGSSLSKYLNYISNLYVNLVQEKIDDDLSINKLRELFNNMKNQNNSYDLLKEFELYIINKINEYNIQIKEVNFIKGMLNTYIDKINIQIKNLNEVDYQNDKLFENAIKNKIYNLEVNLALIIQRIEKIDLIFSTSLKIQNTLDYLKNISLPHLYMNLADNENIEVLSNINQMIDENIKFKNENMKKISKK